MVLRRSSWLFCSLVGSLAFTGACGGDNQSAKTSSNGGTHATAGGAAQANGGQGVAGSGGANSSAGASGSIGQGGAASGGASAAQAGSSTSSAGATAIETGTSTATVTLVPATTYQTLEGFGAAVAWYQGTLTKHTKSSELYRVLFAELGLDLLRFRNTFGRSEFGDATAEKAILDAATASLGRKPKVLLTSWSPPAALKANNVEKCSGEDTCTLKKTNGAFDYSQFASYWSDSLAAYEKAGVSVDWASIQNEPDFIPNGWEGCKFDAKESAAYPGYAEALKAVSTQLASLPAAPKLIGPEVLGVHWNRMQTYMPALDKSLIVAAAHHLYEQGNDGVWDWRSPGPDSYTAPMMGARNAAGTLPVFQTEFQTDADNGTEGGFETAWLIHNSLAEEGVAAWFYWDLVWTGKGGLVSLPNGTSYTVRDQYYSMRHYSLFTDPGYVRIGASSSKASVRVSAFRSPDQKRVTVVVLNVGSTEEKIGFGLGGYAATGSEVVRTVYVPGASERWTARPRVDTGGLLTLPSRSIATIVFTG